MAASAPATPVVGPGSTPTWLTFAQALLRALGAPDTHNNESALLAWMAGEQPPGSPNAAYNPLNIQAHGYPGEGGIVGTSKGGQFNFADFGTGITQTAHFLSQSRYAGVVANLRTDAPAATTLGAIQSSGWAASGYGGRLVGLLTSITSHWAQYAAGVIAGTGGARATAIGFNPLGPLDPTGGVLSGGLGSLFGGAADALGLSGLLDSAFKQLAKWGLMILGVGGGVALLVAGARQATAPQRRKAQEQAAQLAPLAAAL